MQQRVTIKLSRVSALFLMGRYEVQKRLGAALVLLCRFGQSVKGDGSSVDLRCRRSKHFNEPDGDSYVVLHGLSEGLRCERDFWRAQYCDTPCAFRHSVRSQPKII